MQTIKANEVMSDVLRKYLGVTQGSILGVLLNIIYINDMPNDIDKCEIILCANEILIVILEQCYHNLYQEINSVNIWLNMNLS